MAPLINPHWDAVPSPLHDLLIIVGRQDFSKRMYLAGGTALALRIGHRRSNDLDFFSETDEILAGTRDEIIAALTGRQLQVMENVNGNLLLLVSGMPIGFFSYGYSMVAPPDAVENVFIASIEDVGLMKLDALISRGSMKDFFDLYFVAKEIPFNKLLRLGQKKYPYARDFPLMAIEGMVQFDNAERDVPPIMLQHVAWDEVKSFFIAEAKRLGQKWIIGEEPDS